MSYESITTHLVHGSEGEKELCKILLRHEKYEEELLGRLSTVIKVDWDAFERLPIVQFANCLYEHCAYIPNGTGGEYPGDV